MREFIGRRIVAEYCRRFNAQDTELYRGDIPNAEAEEFLTEQIPRFDCSDPVFREIWYFRWWSSFRKHIRTTPYGRVLLEFMPDVPWAGAFNAICCPAAHQLREARWLRDKGIAGEHLAFWMNPEAAASPRCCRRRAGITFCSTVSGYRGTNSRCSSTATAAATGAARDSPSIWMALKCHVFRLSPEESTPCCDAEKAGRALLFPGGIRSGICR